MSGSPEDLIFEANLKEFATRVGLIVGLEIGGKLDGEDAYKQIKKLWKQLRSSKRNLLQPPGDDETGDDNDDADRHSDR